MSSAIECERAAEVKNTAEDLLAYLETSETPPTGDNSPWLHNSGKFGAVLPISEIEADTSEIPLMSDEEMRQPKNWPVWPLDICYGTFYPEPEPENGWHCARWQVQRLRTTTPKEWRGKAKLVSPWMAISTTSVITVDGKHRGVEVPISFAGGRWVSALPNSIVWSGDALNCHPEKMINRGGDRHNRAMEMAFTMALVPRYHWCVDIGFHGPAVTFVTDPVGAREVFSLRDLPEGRSRRAALRHWVKEHWRKKRTDPLSVAAVREHLRGATQFSWNGLNCRIRPAAYDLERLAKASA